MHLVQFVMDLTIRILLFFFLVHVAIAVKEMRDITADAINSDNAEDHAVGIRRKRGVKDYMDVGSKILKGTGKVITRARIMWRVQQAKLILWQDAQPLSIFPSYKAYMKRGGEQRADGDYFEMHMSFYEIKAVKTFDGDDAIVGQIGKYTVTYRKQNPTCNPPSPTIELVTPATASGAGGKYMIVVYADAIELKRPTVNLMKFKGF